MKNFNFGVSIGTLALAIGAFLFAGEAAAGDFHRLVGTIANGGTICTYSSPKNTSTAMEMGVFEFQTPVSDSYQCCITSNTTGQNLFVRLIGLTGAPLQSFETPVNGTGCTPSVSLGGGFLFQCTVASGAGSPVNSNYYRVCAKRP